MADQQRPTRTLALEPAPNPDWVDLDDYEIPEDVKGVLPRRLLERWRVLPLSVELDETCLVVATAPPALPELIRALTEAAELYVEVVYAAPADINAGLWRAFRIAPGDGWN
ncbi:MAG TPA: hypothetical protein QGF58_09440 [Myxococcota bacterium]|nr:hypothetical protein [Myxococcota bacterium]